MRKGRRGGGLGEKKQTLRQYGEGKQRGAGEVKQWVSSRRQSSPTSEIIHKVQHHHCHQCNCRKEGGKNNVKNHWECHSKESKRSLTDYNLINPHTDRQTENTDCRCRCRKTLPKPGILWCLGWILLPWQWEQVPGSGSTACWCTKAEYQHQCQWEIQLINGHNCVCFNCEYVWDQPCTYKP